MPATVNIVRWTGGSVAADSSNNKYDVNGDRYVDGNDVYDLINYINVHGTGNPPLPGYERYDIDSDGFVSASDVLSIINYLNAHASIPVVMGVNDKYDVNGDGYVDQGDVYALTNYINTNGSGNPPLSGYEQYDVDGDGFVTANDVLMIINYLNANGGKVPVNYYYDTNLDGYVNSSDALAVTNYVNLYGPQPANPGNIQYDANRDGVINSQDVLDIINYLNTYVGATLDIITNVNTVASSSDSHQPSLGSSHSPIKVPEVGLYNYSFWVSTRLRIGSVGAAGIINNIRWYSDGTNNFGSGITCKVAQADKYVQAIGTEGVTGLQLNIINHPRITAAPVAFETYTSAHPLSVTGSGGTANSDCGNFVVYQIVADSSVSAGYTNTEIFTWVYDET